MRKIVAGFAASVDGYIEGPSGEYDWIIIDEKIDFAEELKRFDTFLFGRRSYEAALKMYGGPQEGIANYVFSTTLQKAEKGFVLIRDDVKEKMESLKEKEGKDIALFGGANLLASFLDLRLVDEIAISFIPVLLGAGKPMVDVLTQKVWLSFLNSKRYGNGTVKMNYTVNYSHP